MKLDSQHASPKEQGIYGVRGVLALPRPKNGDGQSVCRWCHGDLPKNRSSWCSSHCFDEYQQRGGHWPSVRKMILRRDKLTCQECGACDPHVMLEVDHITPVCLGGDDRPENLRLLCVACHRRHTSALNMQRRGVMK